MRAFTHGHVPDILPYSIIEMGNKIEMKKKQGRGARIVYGHISDISSYSTLIPRENEIENLRAFVDSRKKKYIVLLGEVL